MTDNTQKDWDATAPFHRINSPYYDTSMAKQADGRGYDCGCRNPDVWLTKLPALGAPLASTYFQAQFVRMLPNWTVISNADHREVEGQLLRSFQTWTDTPMAQWHKWYDWNFHVKPMDGYKYVRGKGNELPSGAGTPVVPPGAMELEWDTGAFSVLPNPMFDTDWAWPMTDQHLWAAGRWIYDCGHADHELMRSELHPVRAVATARWEAVKFEANNTTVLWPPMESQTISADTLFQPAIQFMFFASRFGGYLDFPELLDWGHDYEFIVDLPRIQSAGTAAAVGAQHDFPLNTVVVKAPKLLCSFNFRPFSRFVRTRNSSQMRPQVTYDPATPDQAKVKIPMSQFPSGTEGYGVIVSLGWLDDDNALARNIVHCTVTMGDISVADAKTGSWYFKWGANGRWKTQHFTNVKNGSTLKLDSANNAIDFWLMKNLPTSSGADILINTHGMSEHSVGAFMELPESSRTLHRNAFDRGPVVSWFDVVHGDDQMIADITSSIFTKLATTLNNQNLALGISDLHFQAGSLSAGAKSITGRSMVDNDLAELTWGNGNDYTTSVTIKLDPQTVP